MDFLGFYGFPEGFLWFIGKVSMDFHRGLYGLQGRIPFQLISSESFELAFLKPTTV